MFIIVFAASALDGGEPLFNLALMHMRWQGTPPFRRRRIINSDAEQFECDEARLYLEQNRDRARSYGVIGPSDGIGRLRHRKKRRRDSGNLG